MLVVVDNFTLTVLGWGVRDAQGPAVFAYRAVSLALLVLKRRHAKKPCVQEPATTAVARATGAACVPRARPLGRTGVWEQWIPSGWIRIMSRASREHYHKHQSGSGDGAPA